MLRMDIYINGELLEVQNHVVLTPYQLYLLHLDCRVSNYPAFFSEFSFITPMPSAMPKILSCLVSGSFGIICARRAKISFSLFVMVFTSFLFLRFLSIPVVHIAFYATPTYTDFTGYWHA